MIGKCTELTRNQSTLGNIYLKSNLSRKCIELLHCRREAAASDEQQLRTPEDGRIAQLTTETLVTRINSLLYIEENLPAMEKIVQDRSACISCPLPSLHACHCEEMSHCM